MWMYYVGAALAGVILGIALGVRIVECTTHDNSHDDLSQ
jgi:hypothetical protein